MEASCGRFYLVDHVEATGATCYILDPMRFRIITDFWNKTDRQDARNMAKALWVLLVTGEFGIPTVYKPSETIRTLRRLFASLRRMNAYLGLVPCCHDSGGKSRPGHITRESRKLSRTILTQSIYQTIKGTPGWERDYKELKAGRGSGRARIAMIRRLCGVMRQMLLQGEQFHWLKEELYRRKLVKYQKTLEERKKEQDAA